jgi:hypothetical protein
MSNELAVLSGGAAVQVRDTVGAADVAAVTNRVALMQQVYRNIMVAGIHYGSIPGTPKVKNPITGQMEEKKVLFKPGAEIACVAYQLAVTYPSNRITRVLEKDHILYEITAVLLHNGEVVGEGIGLCSSREEKYAYRKGSIACPDCGAEAIIKGKAEYGGGWICFKAKGGCGKKWTADNAFDSKQAAKIPNENIWEQANTILKMAEKRAMVAATINATACSDLFTQDIEDFVEMPNQSGYNGTGSKEAQAAVRDEKLAAIERQKDARSGAVEQPPVTTEADSAPLGPPQDISEDPIPEAAPKTTKRKATTTAFDFLGDVRKLKDSMIAACGGREEHYRHLLRSFSAQQAYEKSNQITEPAEQKLFLKELQKVELYWTSRAAGGALYDTEGWTMPQANIVYGCARKLGYTPSGVDTIALQAVQEGKTPQWFCNWIRAQYDEVMARKTK